MDGWASRSDPGGDCACPAPDLHEKACEAGTQGCSLTAPGYKCVSWSTDGKSATCDYGWQWRNMRTGDCITARRLCRPGDPSASCCELGLATVHTQTEDSTCFLDTVWGGACPEGYYMLRALEVDANGVVIQPLECRAMEVCNQDQYELRPPGPTQDRVCVYKTHCGLDAFYEAQAATATSDSVCMPRTVCDYATQFLLRWGGEKSDDVCGQLASPCPSGSFLSTPATNANTTANGSAGTCTPFTPCQPGHYASVQGTEDKVRPGACAQWSASVHAR